MTYPLLPAPFCDILSSCTFSLLCWHCCAVFGINYVGIARPKSRKAPFQTSEFRSQESLKIKFFGRIFLRYQGPRRRDIPDIDLCKWPFSVFSHGVAGMSRDLGRDVPDLEKLYARKLGADLSFPEKGS